MDMECWAERASASISLDLLHVVMWVDQQLRQRDLKMGIQRVRIS